MIDGSLEYVDPDTHEMVSERIADARVLEQRLHELASRDTTWFGCAMGVNVHRGPNDVMSVGLEETQWVLIHSPESTDAPEVQFLSLGDPTAEGSTAFYWEQWTECLNTWLVPAGPALRAVQRWFETGERGTEIHWSGVVAALRRAAGMAAS